MPFDSFRNIFSGNTLDRASGKRSDPDWLAARIREPEAVAYALWNGSPLVTGQGDAVRLAELPAKLAMEIEREERDLLFLGIEGRPVFALELAGSADPTEGPLAGAGRFENLRTLASLLPAHESGAAATAKAVFEWRRRHRHCSVCGQVSDNADGGWKRHCPACGTDHFPRTDPVVIMLPVRGERCLLGRQASWDPGRYSALAGFLEPGESIEEACAREVLEESGLLVERVRYHSSQPWPFPTNLMIGLVAEVAEGEAVADLDELEAVRWFTREEARALLDGRLEGLSAPAALAIAHSLLHSWAQG